MEKIRVLIAKPGLDGHDRGALVISQALRDAGMEVIYTGLRQSPKQIVQAAVQEDVDVIGLSSLSGAHNVLFPKVLEELHASDAADILVFGGGVIPHEDIRKLEKQGIRKIFTPGTKMETISSFIERAVRETQGSGESVLAPPTGIDHIGIAVRSIEESLPFYQGHLHLHVERIIEVPEQGVRVAFIPAGNTRLELMEPLKESSPVQRFIDKKGEGLHHLAFGVTSLEERLVQLKNEGVPLINEKPVNGAMGHPIAFLHPKANSGTLVELVEQVHGEEKEDA
ncbi:methylmalonyl-CoA epimerase [Salisediminibacterium beveridgei]|uniref:B12 binding domain of Methylmalonyl-CoA mutase n=1 Tax=Salisediminibacterium beveridgei TaxID=632773 RepID=A0A1D7QUK2_9BACI|nr:methylmalonyl-CoA epimerase [Salisediminibacterium beveridgei]AOM82693.1 B12 binding domain of Methylmalonyl-CoA mutase [Salisediminibacterium beveridgei]